MNNKKSNKKYYIYQIPRGVDQLVIWCTVKTLLVTLSVEISNNMCTCVGSVYTPRGIMVATPRGIVVSNEN